MISRPVYVGIYITLIILSIKNEFRRTYSANVDMVVSFADYIGGIYAIIIKMWRSSDRLKFIMGSPILVRRHLHIETAISAFHCEVKCIVRMYMLMLFLKHPVCIALTCMGSSNHNLIDPISSLTNCYGMMTSSNGNIFRVTGHLCGEFTGPRWIPHTKTSDTELWCLLWSAPE